MVFTTSIKGNPTITVKFDPFPRHVIAMTTNMNMKKLTLNISELSAAGGEAVPGGRSLVRVSVQ